MYNQPEQCTLKNILIAHAQGTDRHTIYDNLSFCAQEKNLNFRQLFEQEKYVGYLKDKGIQVDDDIHVFLTSLNINISENIYQKLIYANDRPINNNIGIHLDKNVITCCFFPQGSARPMRVKGSITKDNDNKYELTIHDKRWIIPCNDLENQLEKISHNYFYLFLQYACDHGYQINPQTNKYTQIVYASNNNLYDLLTALNRHNINDIDSLLIQINSFNFSTKFYQNLYAISGIAFAIVGIVSYANYNAIKDSLINLAIWISHYTSELNLGQNWPFIGIGWQVILLSIMWYNALFSGVQLDHYRTSNLLFQTLAISLRIAAYVLFFGTPAVVTAFAWPLLILASVVDVLQCLYLPAYKLFLGEQQNNTNNLLTAHNDWLSQANVERQQYNSITREQFFTPIFCWNLFTAIAITGIVTINFVFPPSIALTIACIVAPLILSLIKDYMVSRQLKYNIDQRQASIHNIRSDDKPQKPERVLFFQPEPNNINDTNQSANNENSGQEILGVTPQ